MEISERELKQQARDLLDIKGVFNYPLQQGLGSYRGLPDRVMHLNEKVCYLEFKVRKNKLSIYQQAFQAQCQADNIPYFVIRNIEELMEIIG